MMESDKLARLKALKNALPKALTNPPPRISVPEIGTFQPPAKTHSVASADNPGQSQPPEMSAIQQIRQNIDIKNEAIARACSLNNALVMVKAYQEACTASGAMNGLKESEIKLWLTALKKTEYESNLKMLGVKLEETEIPF